MYGRQRTPTRSPTRVTGNTTRPRSVPNSFVRTATATVTLPATALRAGRVSTFSTVASALAVR